MGRYNVSRSYTTDGLNRYTAAGGVSFGYDGRGNLTSSGSDSYTYTRLNELKTGPGVVNMVYDGTGRLLRYHIPVGQMRFTYAGSFLIDERDSTNVIYSRFVPDYGDRCINPQLSRDRHGHRLQPGLADCQHRQEQRRLCLYGALQCQPLLHHRRQLQ